MAGSAKKYVQIGRLLAPAQFVASADFDDPSKSSYSMTVAVFDEESVNNVREKEKYLFPDHQDQLNSNILDDKGELGEEKKDVTLIRIKYPKVDSVTGERLQKPLPGDLALLCCSTRTWNMNGRVGATLTVATAKNMGRCEDPAGLVGRRSSAFQWQ